MRRPTAVNLMFQLRALVDITFHHRDEAGERVMRDITGLMCETLYDPTEVSNIDPHAIVEAYFRLKGCIENFEKTLNGLFLPN